MKKLRDSYYVPVERLRAYDDDFAKLEKQRLPRETPGRRKATRYACRR